MPTISSRMYTAGATKPSISSAFETVTLKCFSCRGIRAWNMAAPRENRRACFAAQGWFLGDRPKLPGMLWGKWTG